MIHLNNTIFSSRCREQGDRAVFFFFFSCRHREENTRALTPGEILRVMNMIIGPGTRQAFFAFNRTEALLGSGTLLVW